MSKAQGQQPLTPQRSAYLETAMELEEALLKAEALATVAYEEGEEIFRSMSDEIQDNYMWALSGLVRQARAAYEAMVQHVAPQRPAYLETAMDLEEALLKAEALAVMACGEGGAVLRRMSDDQQDHYMWALAGFVRQAKAASEAMGQRAAQGGANE